MRLHTGTALLLSVLALAARPGTARAEDRNGLLLDGTLVLPVGQQGRVTSSSGAGGEILMLPEDIMMVELGGFAAVGQAQRDRVSRDLYDLHFMFGLGTLGRSHRAIGVYGALGLDVLGITTHEKRATLRGTTLGVTAQGGMMGRMGDGWLWRASAGYLGAIVPGTGDDLGGLVLQLGLGAEFR